MADPEPSASTAGPRSGGLAGHPPCAVCGARVGGVCGKVPPATLASLAECMVTVAAPPGEIAGGISGAPEARPVCAGVLAEGWLRRVRRGRDGRRRVVGLVTPGQLIEPLRAGGAELEAATEVRICRVETEAYERLRAADPGLRRASLVQAQEELERVRRLAGLLAVEPPAARLAAFLAAATDFQPWTPRREGGGVLVLALPRADVADLVDLPAPTLDPLLEELHDRGLIRILGPERFELPDLAALTDFAGLVERYDRTTA
ncbi:helix-turn-helix domain-containing protein [Albimonas sp. CAU 1670]|uniref:helix-turn-helix domain-containing protein n=1 Tax=Albimonas sp. CAU 1670 TaxID=3032599 RepID=UPI0023D9A3F9|nr:helix-turn-helix domain-containing protein [Albimonas sp. CAU 1670]MDF2233772.1 helix-turn-helix domain-containing protein [Albimonas sp. CAU 1670]